MPTPAAHVHWHTVSAEQSGLSCAMVLAVSFVLPGDVTVVGGLRLVSPGRDDFALQCPVVSRSDYGKGRDVMGRVSAAQSSTFMQSLVAVLSDRWAEAGGAAMFRPIQAGPD